MKKLIAPLVLCCGLYAAAQDPAYPPAPPPPGDVNTAEYFVDNDPGYGLGTPVALTPGVDVTTVPFAVNTASLVAGMHRLFVRSRNADGGWSLTLVQDFVVDGAPPYAVAPTPGNVVKAEYFVDTDPGFGQGIDVPLTPGVDVSNLPITVATGSLVPGTHRLFVRTLNAEGRWSITTIQDFVVSLDPPYTVAIPPGNVVKAEYFVDNDPGFGNGTNVPLTPAVDVSNLNVPVAVGGLGAGIHRLFLRTRNAEGKWSLTNVQDFLVNDDYDYPPAPPTAPSVSEAEYFIDTDPGFGQGAAITFTPGDDISNLPIAVPTAGLGGGTHRLFVRSKQNPWSLTSVVSFVVSGPLPLGFLSFTGQRRDQAVALQWRTDNEVNTLRFDVERSANGGVFTKLGEVTAQNIAGQHSYRFTDAQPLQGLNFYRLKQVDRDGRFKHSAIANVYFGDAGINQLRLFPQPAASTLNVVFGGNGNNALLIQVYDAVGKLVMNERQRAASTVTLQTAGLAKGSYWIVVSDGTTLQQGQFVKQ